MQRENLLPRPLFIAAVVVAAALVVACMMDRSTPSQPSTVQPSGRLEQPALALGAYTVAPPEPAPPPAFTLNVPGCAAPCNPDIAANPALSVQFKFRLTDANRDGYVTKTEWLSAGFVPGNFERRDTCAPFGLLDFLEFTTKGRSCSG